MSCDVKPSTRALFWSMTRRITLVGSSQSNCTSSVVRDRRASPPRTSRAIAAHRRRCPRPRRGTAPESRPAGRSPAATRGRAAPGSRSRTGRAGARAAARARRCSAAISDELREVRLLQLLVERQVEARAAAADVRDVALDAGLARRGSPPSSSPRRASRANELPSGSRRSTSSSGRDDDGKNCCGTKRNATSASGEDRERGDDHDPAVADAPVDQRAEAHGRTASGRRGRDRRAPAAPAAAPAGRAAAPTAARRAMPAAPW